jgi:universal stress protein A
MQADRPKRSKGDIGCKQRARFRNRRTESAALSAYPSRVDTILAATDFSPVTKAVVAQAIALTRGRRARIVLLHVVNPPGLAGTPEGIFTEMVPLLAAMHESGSRKLKKWKEYLVYRGLRIQTVMREGFPAHEIAKEAQRVSAKYVIVGSHGHSGIYDLLVGSTASGVLKRAKCPVVIVHAKKKATR